MSPAELLWNRGHVLEEPCSDGLVGHTPNICGMELTNDSDTCSLTFFQQTNELEEAFDRIMVLEDLVTRQQGKAAYFRLRSR